MKVREEEEVDKIYREVYKDVYPMLIRIVTRITGSTEVAEDLCQEAFIKYYERRSSFLEKDQATYWLIRVVKNLAYNHEKRKGRKRRAYERFSFQPSHEQNNEGEQKVLKDETIVAVREALLDLPYKLRIVLVLKEYIGFNYKEIAQALKISEGNVKIRVFRARQLLEQRFEKGGHYVP